MTHVLVAGAGVGGLCLAQGLRRAGIRTTVFERDPDAGTRGQGYRLHIDGNGDAALRRCLPDALFRRYRDTSSLPGRGKITTFAADFTELASVTVPPADHTAVDRLLMRQILLSDLDVRFGRTVTSAQDTGKDVVVRFADGGVERGDLLVGADGVGSVLRPLVAPDAEVIDTGMRCAYGRTPLSALPALDERLFDGFTSVVGQRGALALAAFRARSHDPELPPVADYLMWAVVGPVPDERDPAALHEFATRFVAGWHPEFRRIVANADVPATFGTPIRTSGPVPWWPTGRITLLGDAIHVMPPTGGVGANTALRDAALLTDLLARTEPRAAFAEYENQMRDYATEVVRQSTRTMTGDKT
ncbi:FAD-dependent oxidoreductase [Labedaea rhizosphaerae]|uniref:2-polyprenyl-6-methoxyphenol hydroxylase-like FAD-dependent oxidoreductase n=1 Tax=Labedaea rhizosphaerae TaxID=598644 RepID=A0A4R6SE72_LABRH|nr:FAD-dependent monooxygenase [Labedaea rhizosphaerae]TDQ00182.1 2-polyprenyl-6-methoxyphenol hydroxylase-like FAD-dependent oxidoreductase [Labedaea rhizosphaerae]